jgi:lysophospholipase
MLNDGKVTNTDAENYQNKLKKQVIPYFNKGKQGHFSGVSGINICFHEIIRGGQDALVMLPGRTEPYLKYSELIFDLDELGYDFFLLDHRGQGLSGRMLKDNHKGHVKDFDHYIEDLNTFLELKKLKEKYRNVYLVAHSMGAAVALWHHIKKGAYFDKMVLSAPMVEIITGAAYPNHVEKFMQIQKFIGNSSEYSIGSGPGELNMPYENNPVTRCPSRFEMARKLEIENNNLVMGGTTNQWVLESLKVGEKIYKNKEKLKKLPILMFQAGKDTYSKMKRQNRICESIDTCRKVYIPDSYHELFHERDMIRDKVIDETISFLRKETF